MKKHIFIIVISLLGFGVFSKSTADVLFAQGFEQKLVPPQFPVVEGSFQLPDNPVTNQLEWIMQQFSENDTSISDINAHFDLTAFGQTAEQTRTFINTIRNDYPNAIITDVIMVTPISLTILIADPLDMSQFGFFNMSTEYTGQKRIKSLSVGAFFGSVQYLDDQNLSLDQAANKFQTLAAETGLLIAQIDDNGICQPVIERNASQLRATASIFKIWVLTAAIEAWRLGDIELDQMITLVASELALGGSINSEPLGTQFSLIEIATLMLGISDNTATDLLHQTIGRDLINQVINGLNLISPEGLTPLLSINEQFHLFFSFNLTKALSYVNGSEAFQENFLATEIVPLGSLTAFPFNNDSLFVPGSWRASPMDVCKTYAHLQNLPEGSDQLKLADTALGAGAALPNVRNQWDRVWYKGGSLESGFNGLHVLTHAWLVQNQGENPYVVVAMTNDSAGGIDVFRVQSIAGRLLDLVAGL